MNSSTTADDDIYRPQKVPIGKRSGSISKTTDTDTEAEDILIEIESRKLKERRAHEEIKSGRFRHPNILTSKSFRLILPGVVTGRAFVFYFNPFSSLSRNNQRVLCNGPAESHHTSQYGVTIDDRLQ